MSNSRVASHAAPRRSTARLQGPTGLDRLRRGDRLGRRGPPLPGAAPTLRVWAGRRRPSRPPRPPRPPAEPRRPCSLAPGGVAPGPAPAGAPALPLRHMTPCSAAATLELRLGAADAPRRPAAGPRAVPRPAQGRPGPSPPADRKDTRHFVSAPDSLHLEAHVPGNQYYRFPEQPVRYSTRMRLRFWYLIAPGPRASSAPGSPSTSESPTAWKVLSDGGPERALTVVGRWAKRRADLPHRARGHHPGPGLPDRHAPTSARSGSTTSPWNPSTTTPAPTAPEHGTPGQAVPGAGVRSDDHPESVEVS